MKDDRVYLLHIQDAIQRVSKLVSKTCQARPRLPMNRRMLRHL